MRRRQAGDLEQAERLVQRAAAMPYDPREEGSPGVRAASLLVYGLVTDAFEDSPEDDAAWLDVVLDVHARLDGPGRAELASVIHGFVLQDAVFDVPPTEARRIRQAVGDAPLEADHGDTADLGVDARADVIGSLVVAALELEKALTAG